MYVLTALEADIQDQRARVCLGPAWFSISWQRYGCSLVVVLSFTWWMHSMCLWVGQERACSLPPDDVLLTVPSCGEKGQKPQYLLYKVTDLIPAPTHSGPHLSLSVSTNSPLVHLYLEHLRASDTDRDSSTLSSMGLDNQPMQEWDAKYRETLRYRLLTWLRAGVFKLHWLGSNSSEFTKILISRCFWEKGTTL